MDTSEATAGRTDAPLTVREAETPSGKVAGDENFPVGSFLLPAHLRPVIACFYGFARAADDIAGQSGTIARLEDRAARPYGRQP